MVGVPITRAGYDRLSEELKRLQKKELPEVIKAIEVAREFGDISENAEYHAAKEKQGLIRAKMNDLQVKLGEAKVMDPPPPNGRVIFGAQVTLYDVDEDKELSYRIVGPYESEPEKGDISSASPLGQALLTKEEGDEVKIRTPNGLRTLEIVEIK